MPLRHVYGRTQPIVTSTETLVSDPEESVTALSDWGTLRTYTVTVADLKTSSFEVKSMLISYTFKSGTAGGQTRVQVNGVVIDTINTDTTSRTYEYSFPILDYSKNYEIKIDGKEGSANTVTLSGCLVEGVGIRTW